MFYSPPVSQSSTSQLCHQSFKQSQISTQIIESSQPSSHQPNSQISPQLLNKQKSDEFTRIKETGDYRYLQQQLCNTDLFKHIEGENFFENIPSLSSIICDQYKSNVSDFHNRKFNSLVESCIPNIVASK